MISRFSRCTRRTLALALLGCLSLVNPVHADAYEWQRIEIPHFTIYFTPKSKAYANQVAVAAPGVYQKISQFFDVQPDHCSIVIWPNQDEFNGGFSSLPDRIDLYDTIQTDYETHGIAAHNVIEDVLTHEYTHFVHMSIVLPEYRILIPFYGDAFLSFNRMAPYWFIEGLAVFMESYQTASGRGNSASFHSDYLQHSAVHPYNYWQASVQTPSQLPLSRGYEYGYHFVAYIHQKYGKAAVVNLAKSYDPLKYFFRFSAAIESATKTPFEQVVAEFEAQRHLPKLSLAPGSRSLFAAGGDPILGYAWEGSTLWIAKGTGKTLAEWVAIDSQTSTKQRYPMQRLGGLSPVVPIQNRLWLAARHPNTDGRETYSNLFSVSPTTNEWRQETHGGHLFDFDFSKVANTLVAVKNDGIRSALVQITPGAESEVELISTTNVTFYAPRFSADGQKLVFSAHRNGQLNALLFDMKSKTLSSDFSDIPMNVRSPALHPSEKWLLFLGDASQQWQIYAQNIQTRRFIQLTQNTALGVESPQWSPSGDDISYIDHLADGDHVTVMPFNPTTATAVTPTRRVPPASLLSRESAYPEVSFPVQPGIPLSAYTPYHIGYVPNPLASIRASNLGPHIGVLGASPTVETRYFAGVGIGYSTSSVYPSITGGITNRSLGPEWGTYVSHVGQFGNAAYTQDIWGIFSSFELFHRTFPTIQASTIDLGLDLQTTRYNGTASIDNIVSLSHRFMDAYSAPKTSAFLSLGYQLQTQFAASITKTPTPFQASLLMKQIIPFETGNTGLVGVYGGSYSYAPALLPHPRVLTRDYFYLAPQWVISGSLAYWQPVGDQDRPLIQGIPGYIWKSKWGFFADATINYPGNLVGASYALDMVVFGLPLPLQFDAGLNISKGGTPIFLIHADSTLL